MGNSAPNREKVSSPRALRDARHCDSSLGFAFAVDWAGQPVVRARICWVMAEVIGAAAALFKETGDSHYDCWYERFWDYAHDYLMDVEGGSWRQELDAENNASSEVWEGKPDIYHLMHCLLVSRLPLAPAMAAPALAMSLLDSCLADDLGRETALGTSVLEQ